MSHPTETTIETQEEKEVLLDSTTTLPTAPPVNDEGTQHEGRASRGETPGLAGRFTSNLVEAFVYWAVLAMIIILFGGEQENFSLLANAAILLGYTLIYYLIRVSMESTLGAGIGKLILRQRVINTDGTKPTWSQAAKRNLWLLAIAIPVIGWLTMFGLAVAIGTSLSSDPDHRSFIDRWAECKVLRPE